MIGNSCVFVFNLSFNKDEVHEQGAIQNDFYCMTGIVLFVVFRPLHTSFTGHCAPTSQLHQEGPVTGCASKL